MYDDFSSGVFPSQYIQHLINEDDIMSDMDYDEDQIQPSSLDLRFGTEAYKVSSSFLPGKDSVSNKIDLLMVGEPIDLSQEYVFEKGCVYIVKLMERLHLPKFVSAIANPKSSTGRIDVFTRLLTDYSCSFDLIKEGYHGDLYAEVSPKTFSIKVKAGVRLSQIRFKFGSIPISDSNLGLISYKKSLTPNFKSNIDNGLIMSVNLESDNNSIVGYKAKHTDRIIDVSKKSYLNVEDYWIPIYANENKNLVLEPDEFYILSSYENIYVPEDMAAEMVATDISFGEFRAHYAGFFDPGFGHPDENGNGAKAVLEVRTRDVSYLIEHKQPIGRLVYYKMSEVPKVIYGSNLIESNYRNQGLKLSKHFK